ncbi:MAG: DGQHR domain-containing protein DpdB [bacterium]|nr:DGQHR domain-containing protein DpdB [bacterium]
MPPIKSTEVTATPIPQGQKTLKRRGIKLAQTSETGIYLFALTGEELLAVADVSRISRDETGKLIGYQRPEVKRHIKDIVDYLDGEQVIFPHAVIVAFSSKVKFTSSRGPKVSDGLSTAGELTIHLPKTGEPKPGWIVDGQQRTLAISKSRRKQLPIPVCAFITDDVEVQRDQFLRINNSKPLPRGLVTELLPEVSAPISASTAASKLPSALVNSLNQEKASPFLGLIKRTSTSEDDRESAVIPDGPLLKALRESLVHPSGCLFAYRNLASNEADVDRIWATVLTFWTAVKRTFPEAWGKPPKESRLMHSAGLTAMSRLMDRMMPHITLGAGNSVAAVVEELELVKPFCRWTGGTWEALDLEWNQVENVSRHVRGLTNFLVRTYVERRAAEQ